MHDRCGSCLADGGMLSRGLILGHCGSLFGTPRRIKYALILVLGLLG